MTTRFTSALAVAAGLAAGLGLVAGASAQTPQKGGTAIFTLGQDPVSVNPDTSTNVPDRQIGCITYQGLLQISPDYKLMPLLAKSWTVSPDGLTYTFELNKAEWSDGKPFTSADVKYSVTEVSTKFSSIFARAGNNIDSIETPAPDKVIFKLKQEFGPFLISMGCIQGGAVLPAHIFQGTDPLKNPATVEKPVGTGAFTMAEWKRGDYVKLAKNPKYYEPGKPYLDEIIGKIITSPAARFQALRAGEVDLVQFFLASDAPAVRADPKLKIEYSDVAPESSMAFFNVDRKPFGDKRVRQALMMATDREYLIKNAFFDVGTVGTAPFSTKIGWAANPDIDYRKMYPYDIAKADALLDAAGVKKGPDGKRFPVKIVLFANQYPEFQLVAQAMKSMWQPLGIDVSIEALEDATMIKRAYVDRDFDITMIVYTSYSDPALGVVRTFSQAMVGKPFGNPSGYWKPELEELFTKGEHQTSYEARAPFYQKAQVILADELPVLQLRQYTEVDGVSKKLHDVWGKAQGNGAWTDAWIEK